MNSKEITRKRGFQENSTEKNKNYTKKKKTESFSSSSSKSEEIRLDESDSGEELDDTNTKCLFCGGKFYERIRGEKWTQCQVSCQWTHEKCGGVTNITYICDFCLP